MLFIDDIAFMYLEMICLNHCLLFIETLFRDFVCSNNCVQSESKLQAGLHVFRGR